MVDKHIVFLVGSYAPNFSAVGVCVSKIINAVKDKNRITIISIKNVEDQQEIEIDDNVEIRRVCSLSHKLYNYTNYHKKGWKKQIIKPVSIVYRIAQYFRDLFCKNVMINDGLINRYKSELEKIARTNRIDCVIGCSFPFEAVVATSDYCYTHKDTKGIGYLFDPFSENKLIYRTYFNYRRKFSNSLLFEKRILNSLDLVIGMHIWESHFNRHYSQYNNIVIAEHPLLDITKRYRHCKYEGRRILYAGALHAKIRNPSYAFRLIDKLLEDSENIEFSIYTSDYSTVFQNYELKYPNRFHFYGRKPLEDILYAEYENDIMLSIGNSAETPQTPSKIFEYISTGNPIIHLAKYDQDPCINVLEKYGNAIILKENEIINSSKLIKQISELQPISDRDILSKIYYDAAPDFVVAKINKLLS